MYFENQIDDIPKKPCENLIHICPTLAYEDANHVEGNWDFVFEIDLPSIARVLSYFREGPISNYDFFK